MDWRHGSYLVTDDPARLDFEVVHGYLSRSYWAKDIPRATLERALANSLCFGLFEEGRQIGLVRVITDRATFAYLCDVFVLEEQRARGGARFLLECVHAHPDLRGLRRWMLVTRDAHGLYERFGWRVTAEPERHMEILDRDAYRRLGQSAT